MVFPIYQQLQRQWFFWFWRQDLNFHVLLVNKCPKPLATSAEGIPLLDLENHSKLVVFWLSAIHMLFQHSISFHNIFFQFKAKYEADILFFQVYHYLGTSNSQIKQYILVYNNMLLNNPMFYSFIPSRKWLSRLYCIYIEWKKLVLAALLSSHGQPGNFNCIMYFSWSTIICYIILQKAYIEQTIQFKLTANALSIITAI